MINLVAFAHATQLHVQGFFQELPEFLSIPCNVHYIGPFSLLVATLVVPQHATAGQSLCSRGGCDMLTNQ